MMLKIFIIIALIAIITTVEDQTIGQDLRLAGKGGNRYSAGVRYRIVFGLKMVDKLLNEIDMGMDTVLNSSKKPLSKYMCFKIGEIPKI